MTLNEAKTIARLIGYADRGCNNCVHDLVVEANRLFPQFTWKSTDENETEQYFAEWQDSTDEPLTRSYIEVTVEPAP